MADRLLRLLLVLVGGFFLRDALAAVQQFDWQIQYTDVTRLCNSKSVVSVNGEFPGPTIYVREGDNVVVTVTNFVPYNVTIHWHGVPQRLTAWSDGTAYITQCPIQTNQSYVHNFTITGQRGTLFWHAHFSWLRATLYGAFVILPEETVSYPFPLPAEGITLVLGEWWIANVEDIVAQALALGGGYNISDALTINGQPGDFYSCSEQDTLIYNVTQGETYLLRVVNAAINFQMFFAITDHMLTVVEIDAAYTESYTTDTILLSPGQTTSVLLTADQGIGQYYIAASVFSPAPTSLVPFPQTPTTAILSYNGATPSSKALPSFPAFNDTSFAANFRQSLKSLPFSTGYYDVEVPQEVSNQFLFTVGYSSQPCPLGMTCAGPNGDRIFAAVNNITFDTPSTSILQAYYSQITGVYQQDFPDYPDFQYNYTGPSLNDTYSIVATEIEVLPFNTSVQIVFQDTGNLFFESHPMHLHGQSFYVVGSGDGNYDPNTDPATFNLLNPPYRNTEAVPSGGWTAVRFRTLNPGVWFMHCHFDMHQSWGMSMAFIVQNGIGGEQTLPPPPSDLPAC